VKSLARDKVTDAAMEIVELIGNVQSEQIWEGRVQGSIDADTRKTERKDFIARKYGKTASAENPANWEETWVAAVRGQDVVAVMKCVALGLDVETVFEHATGKTALMLQRVERSREIPETDLGAPHQSVQQRTCPRSRTARQQ
jgi:hypothetical protein